jgi:hypothetical protein
MQSNAAVKFLPVVSDEKKIEVSLQGEQAVIKLSTWTEDLGWLTQKTMSLDAEMLDDLQRVIAAARVRLSNQNVENQETARSVNVLRFPGVK